MRNFTSMLWRGAALAASALLVAGCAAPVITGGPDVAKSAFGGHKRYAVVTIASNRNFTGGRALLDTFKSAENVPGANSQAMIDRLTPHIMSTMAHSGQFTLMPESRVLANRAYRAATEDPREQGVAVFKMDLNVAHGYRYFSEPQKFAQLAQDLGVDGVIAVHVDFSVGAADMGTSINGISLGAKRYSSTANASAVAYNQKGEVVWKDQTQKEADPADTRAVVVLDTSTFTGADYAKLQPSAVEVGSEAVDVLLARLEDTLAGRSVARVQWTK
jgi:hypothetical protein